MPYIQRTRRKFSSSFSINRTGEPTDIIQLSNRDKFIWHALVKGLKTGQLYGYKVRGEYRPEWGLRFNEAKLLLDPYAKAESNP